MFFDKMEQEEAVEETRPKDDAPFHPQNDQYIETPFHIIESYFKGHHLERLVRHQLESYNNFVEYQITRTIEMFNPVRIVSEQDYVPNLGKYALEIYVTFLDFGIYRPQIHLCGGDDGRCKRKVCGSFRRRIRKHSNLSQDLEQNSHWKITNHVKIQHLSFKPVHSRREHSNR